MASKKISDLNVSVQLDTDQAQKDARNLDKDIKGLNKQISNADRTTERYENQLEELSRQYRTGRISTKQYEDAQTRLNSKMVRSATSMDRMRKETERYNREQSKLNKLVSGFKGMGGFLGTLGIGIGAVGVTSAFRSITESLQEMDEVIKSARKIDFGVNNLQAFRLLAEEGGVNVQILTQALGAFNRRLGQVANTGKGEAAPALKQLGLSVDFLLQLKAEKRFRLVAKALSEITEETKRAALADQLFSEAGRQMNAIFSKVSEIDNYKRAIQDLGVAIDETAVNSIENANDRLGQFEKRWKGLKQSLATSNTVLDSIELADRGVSFSAKKREYKELLAEAEKLGLSIKGSERSFTNAIRDLKNLFDFNGEGRKGVNDRVERENDALINTLRNRIEAEKQRIEQLNEIRNKEGLIPQGPWTEGFGKSLFKSFTLDLEKNYEGSVSEMMFSSLQRSIMDQVKSDLPNSSISAVNNEIDRRFKISGLNDIYYGDHLSAMGLFQIARTAGQGIVGPMPETNAQKGEQALKGAMGLAKLAGEMLPKLGSGLGSAISGLDIGGLARTAIGMNKADAKQQADAFKAFADSIDNAKRASRLDAISGGQAEMDRFRNFRAEAKANASFGAASSFSAGSVEEFEFRRDKQLQAEKIAEEKRLAKEEREFQAALNQRIIETLLEIGGADPLAGDDFNGVN